MGTGGQIFQNFSSQVFTNIWDSLTAYPILNNFHILFEINIYGFSQSYPEQKYLQDKSHEHKWWSLRETRYKESLRSLICLESEPLHPFAQIKLSWTIISTNLFPSSSSNIWSMVCFIFIRVDMLALQSSWLKASIIYFHKFLKIRGLKLITDLKPFADRNW